MGNGLEGTLQKQAPQRPTDRRTDVHLTIAREAHWRPGEVRGHRQDGQERKAGRAWAQLARPRGV